LLLLMLAVVVLPPMALIVVHREDRPWKATYFTRPDFSGTRLVQREPGPGRDGGMRIPENLPRGKAYSVRWETVLETRRGGRAAFMLSANGGSRMLINGRPAIDNWAPPDQDRMTRGVQVDLPAGDVRITVEHVVRVAHPFLALEASLDGRPPGRIAAERLKYPE